MIHSGKRRKGGSPPGRAHTVYFTLQQKETKITMSRKYLDLSKYPRLDHFNHFLSMNHPFVSVTVQVDITDFIKKLKVSGCPFFLSFQYAVLLYSSAARRHLPLLQRGCRSALYAVPRREPLKTGGCPAFRAPGGRRRRSQLSLYIQHPLVQLH